MFASCVPISMKRRQFARLVSWFVFAYSSRWAAAPHPQPLLADNCHHRKSPSVASVRRLQPAWVSKPKTKPTPSHNIRAHPAPHSIPPSPGDVIRRPGRWLHTMVIPRLWLHRQTAKNETTNNHNNRPTHWHGGTNGPSEIRPFLDLEIIPYFSDIGTRQRYILCILQSNPFLGTPNGFGLRSMICKIRYLVSSPINGYSCNPFLKNICISLDPLILMFLILFGLKKGSDKIAKCCDPPMKLWN